MTSYRSLLFKSLPIHGESLVGYLIRLAELNRYPRMTWIGSLAGISLTEETLSKIASKLGQLAKIVGRTEDEMKSLSFYTSARGNNSYVVLLTGDIVPKQFFYWPSKRVCFSCLKEKGFISGLWDLKFVTHCPDHGELLRDACPSCGEDVKFDRGRIVPCLPGCQFKAEPAECSREVKALMQLISNNLIGTAFELGAYRFSPQLLNGNLYQLLQAISFLSVRRWHESEDLDDKWHRDESGFVLSNVERVAKAFVNWPHGYCDFIDGLCAGRGSPDGMFHMHQLFGGFYKALVSKRSQIGFLFDGLQDYMNDRLSSGFVSARGNPSIFREQDCRVFMPGFVARKQLGVGKQEFKKLVEEGYLQSRVFETDYGQVICVHRESIKEYAEVKTRFLGRKQVAEELGISQQALYGLNTANILVPMHSPERDGWHKWLYDREVIETWLDDLRKCAKPPSQAKKALGLGAAVFKYNKQGLNYSKLLTAINFGPLRLYVYRGDKAKGLRAFYVDEVQLGNWYGNV